VISGNSEPIPRPFGAGAINPLRPPWPPSALADLSTGDFPALSAKARDARQRLLVDAWRIVTNDAVRNRGPQLGRFRFAAI